MEKAWNADARRTPFTGVNMTSNNGIDDEDVEFVESNDRVPVESSIRHRNVRSENNKINPELK